MKLARVGVFAWHMAAGTAMFAGVAWCASLLDSYMQHLEAEGKPWTLLVPLTAAEYYLVAVDLYVFVVFVYRSAGEFLGGSQ